MIQHAHAWVSSECNEVAYDDEEEEDDDDEAAAVNLVRDIGF